MPKYDLAGRTVLITGSTGGLGSALATVLRARGLDKLDRRDLFQSQEATDA